MKKATVLAAVVGVFAAIAQQSASAAESRFGLAEQGDNYVVSTGAGLVFSVSKKNGDVTSMKFGGRECAAPFELSKRYSHYASGLSGSSKITTDKDPAGEWVKITVDDEKLGLIQYYIAHKGDNAIYMANYAEKCPAPGEMRFIAYLDRKVFTHVPAPSDNARSDGGVEGKDVFKNSKTGSTSSKFYNATQIIDGGVHSITGEGIACFMDMGNRETSSGGPFFRDIENQSGEGVTEFYNYMFSGHTQTEPFRPGLKGPYAMQFTNGQKRVAPDYSFIANLDLKGYVPAARRGALKGHVSGLKASDMPVVALSSPAAQYWARPDAKGDYVVQNVLPGTYAATLYDDQLEVAKKNVTIAAGSTAHGDLEPTRITPPAIFRIGTWDGTPNEFLNADKIHDHHPSDAIMAPFKDGNFVIGQSKDIDWPLAEWKDVNNNQRITFSLTADQARTPLTFRIGVTITYNDGRPMIEVNGGAPHAWKSELPEPSEQPKQSRCITRGTYRGHNDIFSFDIPASALHAGTNTIDIHVDGKKSFPGFLNPNIVFDALDLVTTADAKKAAVTVPGR